MFTLDDKIEVFTDDRFSSEAAARHFFASYGEAEVTRKLAEMSGLQGEIEKVLKQKVRQNYGMFMNANEEVNKISMEMTELRKLIDGTSQLIMDVKGNRVAEQGKLKLASLAPHMSSIRSLAAQALQGDFDMLPEELIEQMSAKRGSLSRAKSGQQGVSAWILSAPDDLASFIVEQQYMQAVSIVLKMRGYVTNLKNSPHQGDLSVGSPLGDSVKKVEDRAGQLASILHKSLPNIPQSQLWGEEEQKKRIRWLTQLGQPRLAAEGFTKCQVDLMKRVAKSIEASGDPRQYATDMSHSFYLLLLRSSLEFLRLFADFKADPKIIGALFDWSHTQTRNYVKALAGQIALGVKEYAALCLLQLKPGFDFDSSTVEASVLAQHRDLITAIKSMFPDFPDAFAASCLEYFDWDVSRCCDALINENLPPQLAALDPRHCNQGAKGKVVSKGPLTFAAECLDIAFACSTRLDSASLQGASCLGWLLLPELQHIISGYTEDLLKGCREQVISDNWQGTYARRVLIKNPAHPSIQLQLLRGVGSDQGSGGVVVGVCFDWFTTVMSHFLDEIFAFLKARDDWDTYFHSTHKRHSASSQPRGSGASHHVSLEEQATYSREDVCQLEPHIVSCILRCVLRFTLSLETVEQQQLNNINLQIYHDTISVLIHYTFPSLLETLETHFYFVVHNRESGSNSHTHGPHEVLDACCNRLAEISEGIERSGRVQERVQGVINEDDLEPRALHLVSEEEKRRREERIAAAKIAAVERVKLDLEREAERKIEEARRKKQEEEEAREREWAEHQEKLQREKDAAAEVARRRALGLPDLEPEAEQNGDEDKGEEEDEEEWEDAELQEAIRAARAARKKIEEERIAEEAQRRAEEAEAERVAAEERERNRIEWAEAHPFALRGDNPYGEPPEPEQQQEEEDEDNADGLTGESGKLGSRSTKSRALTTDTGSSPIRFPDSEGGVDDEGEEGGILLDDGEHRGRSRLRSSDSLNNNNNSSEAGAGRSSLRIKPDLDPDPSRRASARFLAPVNAFRAKSPPRTRSSLSEGPDDGSSSPRSGFSNSATSPGPGERFRQPIKAYRKRSPSGRSESPSRSDSVQETLEELRAKHKNNPVLFGASRRLEPRFNFPSVIGNPFMPSEAPPPAPETPFSDEELALVRARSRSMQSTASSDWEALVGGSLALSFSAAGAGAGAGEGLYSARLVDVAAAASAASVYRQRSSSPTDFSSSSGSVHVPARSRLPSGDRFRDPIPGLPQMPVLAGMGSLASFARGDGLALAQPVTPALFTTETTAGSVDASDSAPAAPASGFSSSVASAFASSAPAPSSAAAAAIAAAIAPAAAIAAPQPLGPPASGRFLSSVDQYRARKSPPTLQEPAAPAAPPAPAAPAAPLHLPLPPASAAASAGAGGAGGAGGGSVRFAPVAPAPAPAASFSAPAQAPAAAPAPAPAAAPAPAPAAPAASAAAGPRSPFESPVRSPPSAPVNPFSAQRSASSSPAPASFPASFSASFSASASASASASVPAPVPPFVPAPSSSSIASGGAADFLAKVNKYKAGQIPPPTASLLPATSKPPPKNPFADD